MTNPALTPVKFTCPACGLVSPLLLPDAEGFYVCEGCKTKESAGRAVAEQGIDLGLGIAEQGLFPMMSSAVSGDASEPSEWNDPANAQQSQAWFAVVAALNEVAPDWMLPNISGLDCAVKAIRDLASQASLAKRGTEPSDVLVEAAKWLHAAYDRPPQTPECKCMLDRVDAAIAESAPSEKLLQELLAVMHADGGHHTDAVGLARSVEDALQKYYRLLAPSEKLSGAEADGEVVSTNRGYSTVRWLKPKGDPENAWSYPVGGTKVYLASHAETVPHAPAAFNPAKGSPETAAQMVAVMLMHGTPDQQRQALETVPHVPAGQIVWPTMPARKNQSSVLFEDGYDEGYARCLSDCKAAFASMQAEAPQATKDAEDAT